MLVARRSHNLVEQMDDYSAEMQVGQTVEKLDLERVGQMGRRTVVLLVESLGVNLVGLQEDQQDELLVELMVEKLVEKLDDQLVVCQADLRVLMQVEKWVEQRVDSTVAWKADQTVGLKVGPLDLNEKRYINVEV